MNAIATLAVALSIAALVTVTPLINGLWTGKDRGMVMSAVMASIIGMSGVLACGVGFVEMNTAITDLLAQTRMEYQTWSIVADSRAITGAAMYICGFVGFVGLCATFGLTVGKWPPQRKTRDAG